MPRMNLTCSCGHWHNFTTDSNGYGHYDGNFECAHFTAYVDCNKNWWTIDILCKNCRKKGGFGCGTYFKCCDHSLSRTTN